MTNSAPIPTPLESHQFNRVPVLYQGERVLLAVAPFTLGELSTLMKRLRICRQLGFNQRVEIHLHRNKPRLVPIRSLRLLTDRQTLHDLQDSLVGCLTQASRYERQRYSQSTELRAPIRAFLHRKGQRCPVLDEGYVSGEYPIFRPEDSFPANNQFCTTG